ncbi:MAG: Holliday junction resolvase RecU, partial [Parasporobacterium sp.]|nr:Holliday junction resolvase RecU [Parasporobacterium sp.]
ENFALANVHEHQFNFMKDFEEQGGIAFLLINFTGKDKIYYMRFSELSKFYKRAEDGILKHIKFEELDQKYFVGPKFGVPVHYLEGLNQDINETERLD